MKITFRKHEGAKHSVCGNILRADTSQCRLSVLGIWWISCGRHCDCLFCHFPSSGHYWFLGIANFTFQNQILTCVFGADFSRRWPTSNSSRTGRPVFGFFRRQNDRPKTLLDGIYVDRADSEAVDLTRDWTGQDSEAANPTRDWRRFSSLWDCHISDAKEAGGGDTREY